MGPTLELVELGGIPRDNNLVGTMPTWIGLLTKLERMSLPKKNRMSGTLPQEELAQLVTNFRLDYLDVGQNNFGAPVPDGLCQDDILIEPLECA